MTLKMKLQDQILDQSFDAILGIGIDGTILYANDAASRLFGVKSPKLLGRSYEELIPKEGSVPFSEICERLLLQDKVGTFPVKRLTIFGGTIHVMVSYSPIRDDNGKIHNFSAVYRLVSEFERVSARSQALLETAPDAIVIVNCLGQIVLLNARSVELFGYSKQELLGQDVEVLIPESYVGAHIKHRSKYLTNTKARNMFEGMDLFAKRKDGTQFAAEISLSPLKIDDDLFVSTAIRDVSQRKKSERKFRDLLNSAPDAMVIVNHQGMIQLANIQVTNIFGYDQDELIGQNVSELIPQTHGAHHEKHIKAYFENPKVRSMGPELRLMGCRKSGDSFPVEVSLSPIETEEGLLVSAAIRDITDRKRGELERDDFMAQLKAKNKELEQFAYVVSHDLQEPLRTIMKFSELLTTRYGGSLDEKGRKMLWFVNDSSERLSKLIRHLLEFSRIGCDAQFENVDCNIILHEVVRDLDTLISERGGTVKVADLPQIMSYSTEMRILFLNLIANAVKFSRENIAPIVEVGVEDQETEWQFWVKDNGVGIREDQLERIFIIFQRLHSANLYPGYGIGLTKCQKIVELLKGRIWVESMVGNGSTFFFTIKKYTENCLK